MTIRGHVSLFVALAVALVTFPAAAQSPAAAQPAAAQPDQVQQLEKKLDELLRQAAEIRQQLDTMKGAQPAPATPTPAPSDDLTKIDVVPSSQPQPQPSTETPAKETPPPALTDVQTVNNVPNAAASKVFNPDISVIGNFFGKAGQRNEFEYPGSERQPMQLDEAEVAFEAFVDPYAKAKFFLAATPEGLEVEEGYANFIALPKGFTAKVGKMKATFGKANTWHTHVRPWVDQPLVIHNFFGDEQLADNGISVSHDIQAPGKVFVEATGEVFSGNVENVFERRNSNDLFYNAHLKLFRDISENSNVEVGTSYARGAYSSIGNNQFAGVDVTYRWKPLQQGLYRGLITRAEVIGNRQPLFSKTLLGGYVSADYQLGQRWFTGVRVDAADHVITATNPIPVIYLQRDRAASATLTFWPSEFSQLRAQYRRTRYGFTARDVNELLFQLQFAIGAHGAHTF